MIAIHLLEKKKISEPDKIQINKLVHYQIGIIRNRGTHEHNLDVWRSGKGELVVSRRGKHTKDLKSISPCPRCLLWINEKDMARHMKQCAVTKVRALERRLDGELTEEENVEHRFSQAEAINC